MKKRRRQRFLSLMLVLCMIASAGMMTPLNTSADSTDVNLTEETQQAESALTGGAAADQMQAAAAYTETDIVSVTQNQETMTAADTQTADSGAVPEEAAAPAAEQAGDGTEQSDPAVTESANLTETPSESQAAEGKTEESADGTQGTESTDAPAADKEQKTEQKQDSEETEVSWPAQTFTGHANNITVNVTAAEGIFPEGTTMVTTAVSAQTAKAIANAASDAEAEVVDAIGVDISFRDASGNEIEPKDGKNVQVSMTVDTASSLAGDNFSVVHQSDDGNVQKVTENATAGGAVFESGEFSIYVITSEKEPAIATYHFYDADGNEIISAMQKVKNGEKVYAPTTPEKTGSKFLGWSYAQGVSSIQEGDPGNFGTLTASVSTTRDVRLYSVFQQVYYVFFLDNQDRVSTTKEGASGDVISVEDVVIPLDSTHSVTGWYKEAELINKVESVTLSDHNVTLYPKVEEGHYLYFSSGEGASYVKPVFVAAGKNTVKPDAPTRPGYTFKHWSASEDVSEYAFGSTISEDTTLYAVWEADDDTKYTVIFWKQSVNDDKNAKDNEKTYDYAESETRTGTTGSYASPEDADQNKGYTGFSYNSSKSTSVTINGDGTTILNVYYDRNLLTINFYTWENPKYFWQSGNWSPYKTFTGLYGQTLDQNGYKWQNDYAWYNESKKNQLTFLDAFIFDTLSEYGDQTKIKLYAYKTSGRISISHYKQKLDGSYSYDSPANRTATDGGTFYFSNKYTGFTVNSYKIAQYTPSDEKGWLPATPESSTKYSKNLYIRYTRNSYKLAYYNYNNVAKEETLLYEASLNSYSSYVPTRPAGLPEAYTFQGWFKDKECTVPFDFNSTMPSNDVMIYAKWAAPTYTGTVHMNLEGTGNPMQFTISYGSKINENDMPTVKDSDGHIIKEGSSSYTVTVPKGNTWAGWATKSGNDYIIYNFSTEVYSDITLYPYYINGEKYTVTYSLGEGTGKAPTDIKQYAENAYADIQPASGITPPEGKTFLYWSHGTDKYYPGDKVKITENLGLTAIYGKTSPLTSITYHSNYPTGSGLTDSTHVDKKANNTAITLGKAGFTAPTGYYFAYWVDASGKRYDVGTKIGIDNTSANALKAVWEQKKEITLTANSGEFTYDGTEHTVFGVKKNTFTIDNVTYTVSGFTTQNPKETNAGTYTNNILNTDSIVVKNGDADVTYQFTVNTENGSLKITPKAVTVTADSKGKSYGEKDPELTAQVSGTLGNDTVRYTLSRTEGEAVGTYTITPEGDEKQGNYTVTYETGTFTISKSGTLTLTANGYEGEYDGESHAASAKASITEGTTISYQVGNEEWTTEAPSITDVGEQTVKIKAENANYVTAETKVTLKVTPKAVTVTAENTGKTYGAADPELTATVSGTLNGDTVRYTLSRTEGEAVGTYPITPEGDEKQGNYTVTYETGTFTISKSGTLTLTANGYEGEYDGESHAASAKASITEGTTISYQVGNEEWTTEAPSITDVGEQTVKIKAENANYVTAETKVTLKVTPKAVTVTAENTGKTYGAADPELTATVSGTLNGDTVRYTLSRAEGEAVGTYPITPEGDEKQGNYTVTYETGTFTISKSGTLTLTANGYEGEYDGESHAASAKASITEGTTISYQVGNEEWTTEAPSITDVGEQTVKIKAENANYVTAETKVTLKVTPKAVTVTAENTGKTYGAADPELTATVSGTLNGDTVRYTLSRAEGEAVGTYPITPEGDEKQGNYTVTYETGTFTISKSGTLTLTANGYEGEYDGESHAASAKASITEGTTISYQVGNEEWTTEAPSITDVGEQTVKIKAENANYVTAETKVTLKVTPKAVTVTAENTGKTYGAADPELAATVSGTLNGDTVRYTLSRAEGEAVGTYPITPEGDEKQGNYTVTYETGTFTISKSGTLTLTANGYEGEYDGESHAASAKASITEGTTISYQVGNEEWTTEAPSITDVGEQTVKIKAENANYVTAETKVTLKVTPKAVTVTAENTGKTYGAADPELTATVSGTLNGDTVRYTLSRAEGEAVGTYPITPEGDEKQGNYTVTYETGTFTISKSGSLTLTANGYEGEYDGESHAASAKASITEGTTISYQVGDGEWTTEAPSIKDVGEQTVKIKAENANYVTAETKVTLKVTPKAVTVTAENTGKTYGAADPELTATVSGTLNGDIVRYTLSRAEGEAVGTYPITPEGDEKQGNYTVTYETGTFTISKSGSLTLTANDYEGEYDGESHAASAKASITEGTTISYQVGDGEWTTEAPSIKDVGEQTVKIKAENVNYETASTTVTLKVTPKAVTVTADNKSKTYGEKDPELTATVSGTLDNDTVSYTLSREKGEDVGTYAITPTGEASQGNYTVTVKDGVLTINKKQVEESEEPENPGPTPTPKPETTVTPTPVPVKPEEPKPEEPTQPEKPVIRPQTTVTPTPLVTVPPTELPSTRPVHTGNTIRKNPDTIQEQRTKLVHTGAVRTGDAGMIGVNVIIVLGAAAGIGVLIRKRKKEKKQ